MMIERRAAREIGADDRNRNGNQQRTRCGDHEYSEKANGFTADDPSQHRNGDRDWSINRSQLISEPAQMRLVLLGLPHHLHDFGVARIDRTTRGGDGESGLTIHRAGDDSGSGRLRDLETVRP